MKKVSCVLIFLIAISFGSFAQNQVDALRFSQIMYGGTARSLSMGNAFGALGADFSTLSMNPAGISFYKRSEFSITPSIYADNASSQFNGNSNNDFKYNFNLSNLGIVFAIVPKKAEAVWKGIQFGFGVNRLANYNSSLLIQGPNPETSILNDYLAKAQGTDINNLDPFDTQLAFDTYLLDTLNRSTTSYKSAVPNAGTLQSKHIDCSGSANEFVFTIGGNYNDRLYIGGTFAFPYLRYNQNSTYSEKDAADTIAKFNDMTIHDKNETYGTGFNFKFGMIYRIANWVRIGAAIHTPTFYNLKLNYSRSISASYDDGTKYNADSPQGSFDYKLVTPFRAIGSIAFVIGKFALLSADYEYVDYSTMQLNSNTYDFINENQSIRQDYEATSNVRAGLEIKLAPLCLRGGYQINFSPYKNYINNNGHRTAISAGIGIREKYYFIDFAYVYSKTPDDYYLYPAPYQAPASNNTFTNSNFLLTLGCKF